MSSRTFSPFNRPIIPCCSSLLLGEISNLFFPSLLTSVLVSAVLLLAVVLIARSALRRWLVLCVVAFQCGALLTIAEQQRLASFGERGGFERPHKVRCRGQVEEDPVKRIQGERVDIRVVACQPAERQGEQVVFERPGLVRLYTTGKIEEVWRGDVVLFQATLRSPRDFQNPGKFHYRRLLASRGIAVVGTLSDPRLLIRMADAVRPTSILTQLANSSHGARRQIIRSIEASVEPSSAYILKALTVGWRDMDLPELAQTFSVLGLTHLLAISGLHVVFLGSLTMLVCGALLRPFPKLFLVLPRWKIAAGMAIPLSWLFLFLAGMPLSGVRAGIMMTLLMVSIIVSRRSDPLSTLAVALTIIFMIWPLAFADISLQLSAAAVLGMILIVPRLSSWIKQRARLNLQRRLHRCLVKGVELGAVTFAATLTTLPIVFVHFHQWSPVGLIVNLFAVPYIGGVVFPLSIAGAIGAFINPSIASLVWSLAEKLLAPFLTASSAIESLASHTLFFAAPPWWEIVLFYGAFVWWLGWRWSGRRPIGIALVALLIFMQAVPDWLHRWRGGLALVFFDVGHGDAALLQLPGGEAWLVDAGGLAGSTLDIGKDVITPALWRLGVRNLEGIIISHPHYDHYGGVLSVAELFDPEVIVISGAPAAQEEAERWEELLRDVGGAKRAIDEVTADDIVNLNGEVAIHVLHPRKSDLAKLDVNNASLVFSLHYRDVKFLFTGDLSAEGESMLVQGGELAPHAVLKVAHHGSKTSSQEDFLSAVAPRFAVISTGAYNAYGMPHRQALERLHTTSAKILRTDEQGAITLRSDGKHVWVD